MLVQYFVMGLSACISGGVQDFEPKSMEVAMDKVRLVVENLTLALGGMLGVHTISAPTTGSVVRGV